MRTQQPHNTKYLTGTQTYNLNCQDDVLNVDTSSGLITIVLPNIINNGLDSIPKRFYINDTGNNASVNGITIISLSGNTVNGGTSIVLSTNDISAELFQSSNTEWFISTSSSGSSGTNITVVANYSALPSPSTVMGQFYWCSTSQGTRWLPFSLGGTYYPLGLYYSNGVTWEFLEVPYQSTQAQVDAGTNTDTFVTPNTFSNASKWLTKENAFSILGISKGGTGLSTLGTSLQLIRVDALGTGLEYYTPPYISFAITSLNGLTTSVQVFGTGTGGTDFGIFSVGSTHIFNLPTASSVNRGALSSADWTAFNNKQPSLGFTPENITNKSSSYTVSSTTTYANTKALVDGLATKQNTITVLQITNGGTNSSTPLANSKVMVSTGGAIVESATTTTQLSYVDFTSSGQTQMNTKLQLIAQSTVDGTNVTGTTLNTLTQSVLIPANTFSTGSIFHLQTVYRFVGTNGAKQVRLYANTSSTLSGATLLGTNLTANTTTTLYSIWGKIFVVKSASVTEVGGSAGNTGMASESIATTFSNINIDWTVNQYIIMALQLNVADSGLVSAYKIWR